MEIKICKSNEINDDMWASYINSFNTIFDKSYEKTYFLQKYLITPLNYSFHGFFMSDVGTIAGSCTIIPYKYIFQTEKILIGLAVDVFILPEFRNDPLALFKIYQKLKEELIHNGIFAVVAVPNETSYPYWKNVVKWKDVGYLPYRAFVLNLGNVLKKYKLLNFFSQISAFFLLKLGNCFFFSNNPNCFKIDIFLDEDFLKHRLYDWHKRIKNKDVDFIYRISVEESIRVAYLLRFIDKQSNRSTRKSLYRALKYIKSIENPDIVLFLGIFPLNKSIMIKVPKFMEPQKLILTCDLFDPSNEVYKEMLVLKNWNFSLLNYDVR